MHGRVRVRRTEEQERLRREKKERLECELRAATNKIFECRAEGGHSEKILSLIENVIEKCADTSTLWNYRREIFERMFMLPDCDSHKVKRLLDPELELTTRCLTTNPKSYSVWHHRRWIMNNHPVPSWNSEIEFCNIALKADERNFHCWDYRRFIVSKGKIPTDSELLFTDSALDLNMSNYSAWHYRGELFCSSSPLSESLPVSPPPSNINNELNRSSDSATLPSGELELVHNAIYTDPNDQSPWFYYWWILGRGRRKVYLRELYLSRSLERVLLVFTASKPLSALKRLEVAIKVTFPSSECVSLSVSDLGGWQSALGEPVSAVWWLSIAPDLIASCSPKSDEPLDYNRLQFAVSVCILDVDNSGEPKVCQNPHCPPDHLFCLTCKLEAMRNESLTRVDLNPLRLLNPIISPTNEPDELETELENVRDLVGMEPENKWALLTLIGLLRFVHPPDSACDVSAALETLMRIDPKRCAYYQDIKSSHIIQDALVQTLEDRSREVSLVGVQLLSLKYLDWFTLMTKIDLSGNSITRLPDTLAYLVCLCELNMDDNKLESLNGIKRLPSLLTLSAQRNCLNEIASIEELLFCPKLETVSIDGNKVTGLPDFTRLLAEHPGSKARGQTFIVTYEKSMAF
ncbi:hypothetical protein T265_13116, partial [Opisthorchis viverrini]